MSRVTVVSARRLARTDLGGLLGPQPYAILSLGAASRTTHTR